MSSHQRKDDARCSFLALISPTTGAPGTLVSLTGLNLSASASNDTVFVLVNGMKVPFFLSPFLLPNSVELDLSLGLGTQLVCSPTVVFQVPPFLPAVVTVTVFEKVCVKVCVKVKDSCHCCCKKQKEKFVQKIKEVGSFVFTITSSVTITSVSPTTVIPGTVVTVTGTGFLPGATVTIGGITVPATVISPTELTFVVPPGLPAGTYPITVTNPNGTTGTSTSPNTVTVAGSSACSLLMNPLRMFAVLGASTVTSTEATAITATSGGADVGVYTGSAIVGFTASTPPGPGTTTGILHEADALAQGAQAQATILYDTLAALQSTMTLSGDLGGLTLGPGVYTFSSSAQLTGTLTLDAHGDPAAQFVFQIGSFLTTATGSMVALLNEAQSCNVFWQVGSSATLGTGSTFAGQIVALTSITANTTAAINGRLFARNGAVTLDTNAINPLACSTCP